MPDITLAAKPKIVFIEFNIEEPGAAEGVLHARTVGWNGSTRLEFDVFDKHAPVPLPDDYFTATFDDYIENVWTDQGFLFP